MLIIVGIACGACWLACSHITTLPPRDCTQLEEMILFLSSVFKVLYATQPGVAEQMGVSSAELAITTAQQAFAQADLDHSNRLSLAEFNAWFEGSGLGSFAQGTISAVVDAQAEAEADARASQEQPISLDTVKRVTTLGHRSVDAVLEAFAEVANEEGVLTREAFYSVFGRLMGPLNEEDADLASRIVPALFNAFDSNGEYV